MVQYKLDLVAKKDIEIQDIDLREKQMHKAGIVLLIQGVLTLIFGIAYLAIGVIHFVVHCRVIAKTPNATRALFVWLLASHAFFVLGFLLQIDGGDGSDFMTITYLVSGDYGLPSWWPETLLMNIVVFVPLVVTWVFMRGRYFSLRD